MPNPRLTPQQQIQALIEQLRSALTENVSALQGRPMDQATAQVALTTVNELAGVLGSGPQSNRNLVTWAERNRNAQYNGMLSTAGSLYEMVKSFQTRLNRGAGPLTTPSNQRGMMEHLNYELIRQVYPLLEALRTSHDLWQSYDRMVDRLREDAEPEVEYGPRGAEVMWEDVPTGQISGAFIDEEGTTRTFRGTLDQLTTPEAPTPPYEDGPPSEEQDDGPFDNPGDWSAVLRPGQRPRRIRLRPPNTNG